MKNYLKAQVVVISILFSPISVLAVEGIMPGNSQLAQEMNKLENEIDKINTRSKKVRDISDKYARIANKHKDVLLTYTKQKSSCLNLNDTYRLQRESKELNYRVIELQNKKLKKCTDNLGIITYNFQAMSRDFVKLGQSINTLKDMAEADNSALDSLSVQLDAVKAQIAYEENKLELTKNTVENTIYNYDN